MFRLKKKIKCLGWFINIKNMNTFFLCLMRISGKAEFSLRFSFQSFPLENTSIEKAIQILFIFVLETVPYSIFVSCLSFFN